MVQITSILLAVIIMVILLVAILVLLSGTVPAFNEAMEKLISSVFPK